VAEWVRQTEEAAIEGENYDPQSPPSNDTISPTCSETFSLITPSVQSEPVMNNLQAKVELLEDKLEQESESNKELRLYLKRMEKQISELQNKQSSKILTKV
jgi:phage shock protein A